MKKLLLAIPFIAACITASGQNTGYLGKHVVLKTDLLNGRRPGFQNIDLEVAVSREFSLTVSHYAFSYESTGGTIKTKDPFTVSLPVYDPDLERMSSRSYWKYVTVYPGKSKGQLTTFGAKYYFNRILPAPLGLYSNIEIGTGKAELNYSYKVTFDPVSSNLSDITEGKKDMQENCSFYFISFPSTGYQTFLYKRIAIDARLSFDTYVNDLSGKFLKEYPYPYFSANFLSGGHANVSAGLSFYVKAGLLIF